MKVKNKTISYECTTKKITTTKKTHDNEKKHKNKIKYIFHKIKKI